MPRAVEALYHDGVVELKKKPAEIRRERHVVNLERVRRRKSSVDNWIGVIEGAELGDWKAVRRAALEG